MKKYFIFAAVAAAGLLTSCSSSDDAISENAPVQVVDDDSQRVPIQLGIAASASADVTRGIGTVGNITGNAGNVWKGQKVNIFMFKKGTLLLSRTMDPDHMDGYPTPIYNNTEMTTPDAIASGVAQEVLEDGRIKVRYYPIEQYVGDPLDEDHDNRKADFWGYFVDDAGTGEDGIGVPVGADDADATQVTVPFVIDGSQDLMVAKTADLSDEQQTQLTGDNEENYFSAYSARRDIQPELSFAHQLTRLTFEFEGGTKTSIGWNWDPEANAGAGSWVNSNAAGKKFTGLFVRSVKVKSNTKGDLVVAYTGDAPANNIVWDEEDALETMLSLKSNEIDDQDIEAADAVLFTTNDELDVANDGLTDAVITGTHKTIGEIVTDNATMSAGQAAAINTLLELEGDDAYEAGNDLSNDDATAYAAAKGYKFLGDVKTPAVEAHEATGKLKDLYTPLATFPEINPDAEDYTTFAGVNTAWGAALTYNATEGSVYSQVYKLTGSVTTPAGQNSEFTADDVIVGGALLVQPRAQYEVEVELGQYLKDKDDNETGEGDEYYVRYMPLTFTVDAPNGVSFVKGTSYNVHVKVYGSEQILVTTTLQGWTQDEDLEEIDTEDFGY